MVVGDLLAVFVLMHPRVINFRFYLGQLRTCFADLLLQDSLGLSSIRVYSNADSMRAVCAVVRWP